METNYSFMKKILFIFLLAGLFKESGAQSIGIGIKAGPNLPSQNEAKILAPTIAIVRGIILVPMHYLSLVK